MHVLLSHALTTLVHNLIDHNSLSYGHATTVLLLGSHALEISLISCFLPQILSYWINFAIRFNACLSILRQIHCVLSWSLTFKEANLLCLDLVLVSFKELLWFGVPLNWLVMYFDFLALWDQRSPYWEFALLRIPLLTQKLSLSRAHLIQLPLKVSVLYEILRSLSWLQLWHSTLWGMWSPRGNGILFRLLALLCFLSQVPIELLPVHHALNFKLLSYN